MTTRKRQRCILSKFYIKPQQRVRHRLGHSVVSYRNSTSNHNLFGTNCLYNELYLIEILHQTTTACASSPRPFRCILSKFYIKPQQRVRHRLGHSVVSYRNSTSNHNTRLFQSLARSVVSYRNSTSNHNAAAGPKNDASVVSYRNSTSNHNPHWWLYDRPLVVSYRNSTSNHNCRYPLFIPMELYLIEILHQTTTSSALIVFTTSCILSKFYIKPQRHRRCFARPSGCILSKFYIKPQLRGSLWFLYRGCILSKFYIKPQLITFG